MTRGNRTRPDFAPGHLAKRALCTLLVIAAAVGQRTQPLQAREGDALEQLVRQASRAKQYVASTTNELRAVESLFQHTLQTGEGLDDLETAWAAYRWEILPFEEPRGTLWVVREAAGHACGRGFYVIRPEVRPGLVLQAPHSFADQRTRELALKLFAEGNFAAAAWNTVPRNIVDAAHTTDHTFNAFTRAVVTAYPQAYVVQLHGFASENRTTPAGRSADLVISNGCSYPERFVREAAVLFESRFPYGQSRLYPTQIRELGATTNVQADTMRELGSSRFLHLELSESLRQRLIADPHARSLLLKNLQESTD